MFLEKILIINYNLQCYNLSECHKSQGIFEVFSQYVSGVTPVTRHQTRNKIQILYQMLFNI